MRVLHTSDWHLGQKFINQTRDAEHAASLDWLLGVIHNKGVDVLVVAGDIFDVSNPPVSAEEQYYSFLTRLQKTACRHVVITGGNHDSPSKLNAPRGLLRALNVHVIGSTTDDLEEEIVELHSPTGEIQALIAAVPFLRDRDFKYTLPGETFNARIERIKSGIERHYESVARLATERLEKIARKVPVIAMGHLYARGAEAAPEQANIYIGNLENISADRFSEVFDYVALGHIHRAQEVGGRRNIRYSGSLIPLSFSEVEDVKSVVLADFDENNNLANIRDLAVPVFRRLLTIRGPLAVVEQALSDADDPEELLPAWVEVIVESDTVQAGVDRHLREMAANLNLELLKIRNDVRYKPLEEVISVAALEDLSIDEVFKKRCENEPEDVRESLMITFLELREWANQNADKLR